MREGVLFSVCGVQVLQCVVADCCNSYKTGGVFNISLSFFLFSYPCHETDFEGPTSLRMQWRRFEQQMVTLFRMLKLDGCWVYDPDLRELVPVWDGTVTFGG